MHACMPPPIPRSVSEEDELRGLDIAKHGGFAYDYTSNCADDDISVTKVGF